ncbi:FAD-dependent monooxygenase [Cryptosporangium aurantiacum]|uniref:2-polyprenyl-6-methoxyphenol hydroxylase n=1 Tax=Cryptosporangium aurantiacum TaxID=134849 RepID=A0A1M7L4X3_9ACTN|nr:FAD-dependent monooxygenase [Cryptosporangium aurantiacum]SHM72927.1 2-polyprenyl-6-methoxyphenol hydroxylase [Cryptosporangium aurantiacum]
MPAVQNVLVVGGGAAGAASAILLAERGIAVEVVELKPDVTALGSGITLQGNALRVLRQLGVWEKVSAKGYAFNDLGIRAPDPNGTVVAEFPDARTGGPELPATLGMYRPDLAAILMARAGDVGVKVRFGTTFADLTQDENGVDVTFSDGSTGRYDLVIGADGIRSAVRRALGVELETRPTGMGIWRVFAPRPASVTRTDLIYGGPSYIAGYCPTGEDTLYAYIVEKAQDRSGLSPEEQLATMVELSQAYHGPWDDIRPGLTDPTRVNYTWFEQHVLDAPWNRGRVVLIGDAAHTCPPTLAQGAAMALEDAAVLAELLVTAEQLDQSVFDVFTTRRYERAKLVVESSVQLGQWLIDGERGDVPGLMGKVSALVSQPA